MVCHTHSSQTKHILPRKQTSVAGTFDKLKASLAEEVNKAMAKPSPSSFSTSRDQHYVSSTGKAPDIGSLLIYSPKEDEIVLDEIETGAQMIENLEKLLRERPVVTIDPLGGALNHIIKDPEILEALRMNITRYGNPEDIGE